MDTMANNHNHIMDISEVYFSHELMSCADWLQNLISEAVLPNHFLGNFSWMQWPKQKCLIDTS